MQCLVPKCKSTTRTRSLCHPHYQQARARIRAGRATEEDLVRRGLMSPAGEAGSTPAVSARGIFDLGSEVRGDGGAA